MNRYYKEVWVSILNTKHEEDAERKILDDLSMELRKTVEYGFLVKSLSPLIESAKTSDSAKQFLKPHARILAERFEKNGKRMMLFKEDAKAKGKDEITTLRKAFLYLGLFESSVINLIDFILMIFIATHHDFYVYDNRAYAKGLDDLNNASLGQKLSFLNYHGLQIFSQNLNKDLRNKIAHMDFDVNSDGTILVSQQKFDLEYEILKLSAFVLIIGETLASCSVSYLLNELQQ